MGSMKIWERETGEGEGMIEFCKKGEVEGEVESGGKGSRRFKNVRDTMPICWTIYWMMLFSIPHGLSFSASGGICRGRERRNGKERSGRGMGLCWCCGGKAWGLRMRRTWDRMGVGRKEHGVLKQWIFVFNIYGVWNVLCLRSVCLVFWICLLRFLDLSGYFLD